MRILVTGGAGFIGHTVCLRLLQAGHDVVSLDNLNDYYDVALKQARLRRCRAFAAFTPVKADLADALAVETAFRRTAPECVVHLAAQAGVRYSLKAPRDYLHSNLVGFFNLLEACRVHRPAHLVYASSSSVYGASADIPFALDDYANRPVSFYAATKRSGELMAYSYSHLHRLPMTGLRLFTVYGPWGRPDMAYFEFTRRILAGEPVTLYGDERVQRDFTYVDDAVDGIVAALDTPPAADNDRAPHRLFNLGNDRPRRLREFVALLERNLGRSAEIRHAPLPPGDVPATWADISLAREVLGFQPRTGLEDGLERFVAWYLDWVAGRGHPAVSAS